MVDKGRCARIYFALVELGKNWHKCHPKKLFFNLRKAKNRIGAYEGGDLTPQHTQLIADNLSVAPRDVTDMNRRLSGGDFSLNVPIGKTDTDAQSEWQDTLVDPNADHALAYEINEEMDEQKSQLYQAMQQLKPRERDILYHRRIQDPSDTLDILSKRFGISRERVRQIEVRAFEKLRSILIDASPAPALS